MSVTKVTPEHLRNYLDRHYDDIPDDFARIPLDHLYEALCEVIVEENEGYAMEQLTDEWRSSEENAEEFAKEKFDAVVSSESEAIVPIQHRYKWIKAVVQGLYEYSEAHNYQDAPEEFKN